jgi:hypothetical protein
MCGGVSDRWMREIVHPIEKMVDRGVDEDLGGAREVGEADIHGPPAGREAQAESRTDLINAHMARAGRATEPITLRTHTSDAGSEIPPRTIWEATAGAPEEPWIYRSAAGLERLHGIFAERGVRWDRFKPIGPINPNFNCHGYTFSRNGEAGWLAGRLVDVILTDNGFSRVADLSSARPGDVAIYRDSTGAVTHSAVVSAVSPDGVSVDSKMGALSTARHRIDELLEIYGPQVHIYHTDRPDGRFLMSVENTDINSPRWPPE